MPPGTGYVIPARAGVWRVWCASWGRLGDSGLSLSLAGLVPCGAVFFGVRFGGKGIPENVLISEIYVSACSEAPLQQFSIKKHAFCLKQQLVNAIRVGKEFAPE